MGKNTGVSCESSIRHSRLLPTVKSSTKYFYVLFSDCLWNVGTIKGDAQNVARRLTDSPANLMTPVIFAQNAVKLLDKMSSVEVHVRDKKWAEMNNMNTFLSVAKGSSESPVFLEIIYRGKSSGDRPVVLVGEY